MRNSLLLLFSLFSFAGYAQQQSDSLHCDCGKALSIPIYKKHHHIAPSGHGTVYEFEHNGMQNEKYFDKEHNTIWYSFTIPSDGTLQFDIIADTIKDDYDFILYKQGGRGTCDSILGKTLIPLRANISHNAPKTKGMTGLSAAGHSDFNKPGMHENYSKPLAVKSGERYLLVLDNVYEKGNGHTLKFNFDFKFKGIVLDSTSNKPLTALIALSDLKTNIKLQETSSDSAYGGTFEFPINISDTLKWVLSIGSKGYFSESMVLTQNNITGFLSRSRVFKLRKIIKNKSFALKDINFFPNKDIFKPTSIPALQNLLKVMQDNGTLKILIEGHTNFDPNTTKERDIRLSEDRAAAVKKYLADNGIDETRVTIKGYGSTRMIYAFPRTQDEQQANMRVEIKIEDF